MEDVLKKEKDQDQNQKEKDYQECEKQFIENDQQQVPDKIKQSIKKYYELSVVLKDANEDIKKLKEEMKVLNNKIQRFMIENEVSQFNTDKIDLTIHKTKSVEPINKETIERILTKKYPELEAKEISSFIYENRDKTEKLGLRKKLKNKINF